MIAVYLVNVVNTILRDIGCFTLFMAAIIAFLEMRDKRGQWPFGECDPPPSLLVIKLMLKLVLSAHILCSLVAIHRLTSVYYVNVNWCDNL